MTAGGCIIKERGALINDGKPMASVDPLMKRVNQGLTTLILLFQRRLVIPRSEQGCCVPFSARDRTLASWSSASAQPPRGGFHVISIIQSMFITHTHTHTQRSQGFHQNTSRFFKILQDSFRILGIWYLKSYRGFFEGFLKDSQRFQRI